MAQVADHRDSGLGLVVLVQRQQLPGGSLDALGAQQLLGVARVLAGHRVDLRQHMQRTQRDVGQVADGRGHDVQRALRIMLVRGGLAGGGEGRGIVRADGVGQ